MNMFSLPRFIIPFFAGLVLLQSLLMFAPASAECAGYDSTDPYGLDCGENSNLTEKDLRDLIANLINIVLSLSGIVLIGYILYAGFLWMTAAGEGEQIEKAKSIISACVMGLLIVMASYSIAIFVIGRLRAATGT